MSVELEEFGKKNKRKKKNSEKIIEEESEEEQEEELVTEIDFKKKNGKRKKKKNINYEILIHDYKIPKKLERRYEEKELKLKGEVTKFEDCISIFLNKNIFSILIKIVSILRFNYKVNRNMIIKMNDNNKKLNTKRFYKEVSNSEIISFYGYYLYQENNNKRLDTTSDVFKLWRQEHDSSLYIGEKRYSAILHCILPNDEEIKELVEEINKTNLSKIEFNKEEVALININLDKQLIEYQMNLNQKIL
jgi:hypothetical protein